MFYLLELLKPKIILGNLISLCGGYCLASRGQLDFRLLFFNSISLFLVIGSACILNNVIDCRIDKYMTRTQNRVLVKYKKFCNLAIFISICMLFLGLLVCVLFINFLCFFLFVIGWIVYVILYSIFLKKTSAYSTVIGSIAGSLPPIIGYCSIKHCFDLCALNLLAIFSFWQIPHSYAICILYFRDYTIANIPVFPIVYGLKKTKIHIIMYIVLFFCSSIFLTVLNITGYRYCITLCIFCIIWLYYAFLKLNSENSVLWAKSVFRWSIIIIFIENIFMSFDYV